MTAAFYNKAQGVIITFDVTQKESFKALPAWIDDVRKVMHASIPIRHSDSSLA